MRKDNIQREGIMKMQQSIVVITLTLLLSVIAGTAAASVVVIGTADYYNGPTKVGTYNLIYNAAAPFGPIVWLDYAYTQGLASTWSNQFTWASGLNGTGTYTISNYVLNTGYSMNWTSAWRLPSTVDGPFVYGVDGTTTGGYNINNSELGHLYYTELGNKGYYDTSGNVQPGSGLTNTGPFNNLVADWYWSGTEYATNTNNAWSFNAAVGPGIPAGGFQTSGGKVGTAYALAVRPGLLETSAVPEPSTYLLLSIGLGVVGYARKRLNRQR